MLLQPLLLLVFICCTNAASILINKYNNCGYETCQKPDPKKLNIHIIAHSHDDVGWLKTVDQYYYGSRTLTQDAGVQYIIDSYVEALYKNPERKFIQVETAFFWQWWKQQTTEVKNKVRQLIDTGRLEIIGGGWSMPDEAATHYHSLIDQYTWGFRRLDDSLGECGRPKIGWQIDPFGHSREQAAMFAQFGFDGYFFGRLDWNEKNIRLRNKTTEFIWKANPSLGSKADIFTGINFNTYSPPPGFCFDVLCADDPIIDDPLSPEYNVPKKVDAFLNYTMKQSSYYRTNNALMTMGGDFTYQYAEMYFKNLDKLIRYANERNGSEFNMFYSTPSCYLKALYDQNLKWPIKTDDFFPYASDPHSYWTGYFTSRPTLKYFERMGNNYLQIIKQLATIEHEEINDKYLNEYREAMGILQHHDAVSGTEKQHVAQDYARILYKAMSDSDRIMENTMRKLIAKDAIPNMELKTCLLLNVSSCEAIEDEKTFVVTIYNPSSHVMSKYIRLPVTENKYNVKDSTGVNIRTTIIPIIKRMQDVPGRFSKATHELVFEATDLPAIGFKSYYISVDEESVQSENPVFKKIDTKPFILKTVNQNFDIELDDVNGITIKRNTEDAKVLPSVMYYEAALGNNEIFENRSSGAYIFRPNVTHPLNFNTSSMHVYYLETNLVTEVYVERTDWITELIRVYRSNDFVEYNWLVGPIPVNDNKGKEIIIRYNSTTGNTKGVFYTDSNGRQILRRERRYPNTEDKNNTFKEPIAGNYYPITNKIYLQNDDTKVRFAVLNDRSQGGSSLNDGQLELMALRMIPDRNRKVHRRLLHDDAFGVGEALNETAFGEGLVATGKHYLHFGNIETNKDLIKVEKMQTVQLALQPWLFFTPLNNVSFDEYKSKHRMEYSIFKKSLPENIHILTLEPWKDGTILLRLEHLYEVGESNDMSQVVEINIQDLFSTFNVASITEMTLGANQKLNTLNRLKWTAEEENTLESSMDDTLEYNESNINIVMKPSKIRTFIIEKSI